MGNCGGKTSQSYDTSSTLYMYTFKQVQSLNGEFSNQTQRAMDKVKQLLKERDLPYDKKFMLEYEVDTLMQQNLSLADEEGRLAALVCAEPQTFEQLPALLKAKEQRRMEERAREIKCFMSNQIFHLKAVHNIQL